MSRWKRLLQPGLLVETKVEFLAKDIYLVFEIQYRKISLGLMQTNRHGCRAYFSLEITTVFALNQ